MLGRLTKQLLIKMMLLVKKKEASHTFHSFMRNPFIRLKIDLFKQNNISSYSHLWNEQLISSHHSFTFNRRKLFNVTSNVAPISAKTAIQSVNQPGTTNNNANALITKEKVMFCLIIAKDLRLNLTVYGNLLKSSDINAISAVSNAVSVPAPPIATPTVDASSAVASFTPSPTIAAPPYFLRIALIKFSLSSGSKSALMSDTPTC